jgi:deltex
VTYGVRTGEMPDGGMQWSVSNYSLPGFNGSQTINFSYNFPSGSRKGVGYAGTSRAAYLPTTPEGIIVFKMMILAFKRKVTFKIGTSVTNGRDNQTVWAGIHHKTSTSGGSSSFGYPDATYLDRVTEELAARNITPEDVENEPYQQSGNIHT